MTKSLYIRHVNRTDDGLTYDLSNGRVVDVRGLRPLLKDNPTMGDHLPGEPVHSAVAELDMFEWMLAN